MKKLLRIEAVALIYLLVMTALILVTSHLQSDFFWGTGLLNRLPMWVDVLFSVTVLSPIIPAVRKRIADLLYGDVQLRNLTWILGSVLTGLICSLFMTNAPIMGDGVDEIYKYTYVFNRHSPLFSFLLSSLTRSIVFLYGNPSVDPYVPSHIMYDVWGMVTAISCSLFIYFSIAISSELSGKQHKYWLIVPVILAISGTFVLFSGFVEVTVVYTTALMIFIYTAVRTLNGSLKPFYVWPVFLFCLGLHASAIALLPAMGLICYWNLRRGRSEILKLGLSAVLSGVAYLLFIVGSVGIKTYFWRFISGQEMIESTVGQKEYAYTLISGAHFVELFNVASLHNILMPLLLFGLIYFVVTKPRALMADHVSIFLLMCTFSYLAELFVFHPALGTFRDWDIFSPVAVLVPFTVFRLWQIGVRERQSRLYANVVALLLPLTLSQGAIWQYTFHNRISLMTKMFDYFKQDEFMSPESRLFISSSLGAYCAFENYYPPKLLDRVMGNIISRGFLVHYASTYADEARMVWLVDSYESQLNEVDFSNLAAGLLDKNPDLAVLYLRKAEKINPDCYLLPKNLYEYYQLKHRKIAATYYYLLLNDKQKEEVKQLMQYEWNEEPIGREASESLRRDMEPAAASDIFNNGIDCLASKKFDIGETEIIKSVEFGADSLKAFDVIGKSALYLKQFQKAEFYIKKCLRIKENEPRYLFCLYWIYLQEHKENEKKDVYRRLLDSGVHAQDIEILTKEYLDKMP